MTPVEVVRFLISIFLTFSRSYLCHPDEDQGLAVLKYIKRNTNSVRVFQQNLKLMKNIY